MLRKAFAGPLFNYKLFNLNRFYEHTLKLIHLPDLPGFLRSSNLLTKQYNTNSLKEFIHVVQIKREKIWYVA